VANLAGYVLHDDKGASNAGAFTFGAGATLAAGAFQVLCANSQTGAGPGFKVGGSDTVTLIDAGAAVVSTSGMLQDEAAPGGTAVAGMTWARDPASAYLYTSTATPGAANVLTTVSPAEAAAAAAADLISLQAQNDAGVRHGLRPAEVPLVQNSTLYTPPRANPSPSPPLTSRLPHPVPCLLQALHSSEWIRMGLESWGTTLWQSCISRSSQKVSTSFYCHVLVTAGLWSRLRLSSCELELRAVQAVPTR
jgi:hypothetical protein